MAENGYQLKESSRQQSDSNWQECSNWHQEPGSWQQSSNWQQEPGSWQQSNNWQQESSSWQQGGSSWNPEVSLHPQASRRQDQPEWSQSGPAGNFDSFRDVNSNKIFSGHNNHGIVATGLQWDTNSETSLSNLLNLIHIMDNSTGNNNSNSQAVCGHNSAHNLGSQSGGDSAVVFPQLEPSHQIRPLPRLPPVPPPFIPCSGRAITGSRPPITQPPPSILPPGLMAAAHVGGGTPPPLAYPDTAPPNFLRVNLRVPPPGHAAGGGPHPQ